MIRITLTALMMAAVCSTAQATEVSEAQLASLQIGTTTYDQVISQLGKPTTIETSADGKTITYIATHTHIKAATYVPIVGLFAGGARAQSSSVKLVFGPDGVLSKTSTSQTDLNCRTFGGCK